MVFVAAFLGAPNIDAVTPDGVRKQIHSHVEGGQPELQMSACQFGDISMPKAER
jgi:hypothetical protein